MRGCTGISTVLIDPPSGQSIRFPHRKISGDEQLGRFYRTGIADSVLRSATHPGENRIARFALPARQRGVKPPCSLLVVILIIIVVVFVVVVGLSGGVMRHMALVVPELAIDAIGREQLRMRAALDRLAA